MNKKIAKKIMRKCSKYFILESIVCLIIRTCLLVVPILYSIMINDITDSYFNSAIKMVVLYIIIISIDKLFEYIRQHTYYKLYNHLYLEYVKTALEETSYNSLYSLSRFNIGEYMNIYSNDIPIICAFYANNVYRLFQCLEFIFIFYYFGTINKVLCILTIVFTFIIFIYLLINGNKIEKLNVDRKQSLDNKVAITTDIYNGIKEIKSFHLLKNMTRRTTDRNTNYLKDNATYNKYFNLVNILSIYSFEILRLILMIIGINHIMNGSMEIGVLVIIYDYYQKIIDNFSVISTTNVEYRDVKVSQNRLEKLFEYAHNYNTEGKVLDNISGNIEFKDVLYGDKKDPTLLDATFYIEAKSLVCITGKTGSGKTGVFELLLKLNKQHKGIITIDNNEINSINDSEYFKLVSIASANPVFFNTSIKDNLEVICEDNKKIIEICKRLNIYDRIMELPNQFDSNINILSTCDKKLIAIARVILKNSKIMLFDEIIETLDKKNKDNILFLIKELKKDHTIVMITRDKSILNKADKIIFLDNGSVIACGTHDELDKNLKEYQNIN